MLKTIIVLPDGTELSSGVNAENAILNITISESVNETQELTIGSACSNKIEARVRVPSGVLPVSTGQEVAVLKADTDSTRYPVGLFTLEKPVWTSANVINLVAYDRMCWLDKDLTEWINGFAEWPMNLHSFAKEVCDACDLTLANDSIPNGSYMVQAFTGSGITGRQLIRWIGQIAGRFARATADGKIEFAWYEPSNKQLMPGGELFFYQNGLSYSDYQTAIIEKVQIQLTENDVGTVWPDISEDVNAYKVTGNYLMSAEKSEDLLPIAQSLFSLLENVSYTPCKVTCPIHMDIHAGSILYITDRNGNQITAYVMSRTISGQRMTLGCTGSYRRDSVSVVNEASYRALTGKVLELKMGVEGIKLENKDTEGRVAALSATVDGIATSVSANKKDIDGAVQSISEVRQSVNQVSIDIANITENGVDKVKTGKGYTFDDDGMHITDHQSDIENTLDNTGMYVKRGSETMLQANKDGVIATDVTVNNYLVIGHSRFEAYRASSDRDRTACFFFEGR